MWFGGYNIFTVFCNYQHNLILEYFHNFKNQLCSFIAYCIYHTSGLRSFGSTLCLCRLFYFGYCISFSIYYVYWRLCENRREQWREDQTEQSIMTSTSMKFITLYVILIINKSNWVMMVHTFNSSTQEAEAGRSLWVQSQPGLQSKFQDSQDFL